MGEDPPTLPTTPPSFQSPWHLGVIIIGNERGLRQKPGKWDDNARRQGSVCLRQPFTSSNHPYAAVSIHGLRQDYWCRSNLFRDLQLLICPRLEAPGLLQNAHGAHNYWESPQIWPQSSGVRRFPWNKQTNINQDIAVIFHFFFFKIFQKWISKWTRPPKTKIISDVNKIYIDISNEQKFELISR